MRVRTAGLALTGLAGVSAPAGAASYVTHHDLFLAIDLPANSRAVSNGGYEAVHDKLPTRLDVAASTPHFSERTVDCGSVAPSWEISKPQVFAYSCKTAGRVIYHVEKFGRTSRVGASDATQVIEFTIRYPAIQRAFWDPVVTHMSKSLRFAPTREKIHG